MSNNTFKQLPANAEVGVTARSGKFHYGVPRGPEGQLEQLCGASRRQLEYLLELDNEHRGTVPVDCKRCLATYGPNDLKPAKLAKAAKASKKSSPKSAKPAAEKSSAAKGFAAQGKGHADSTKRIMAERTPEGKASVVRELFAGLKGWTAKVSEDGLTVTATAKGGRKVVVTYPTKGHPAVRTFNDKEHKGNRRPNVSAAYSWAQS